MILDAEKPAAGPGAEPRGQSRWRTRIRRTIRAFLISNLILLGVIGMTAFAAHRWVTASEENMQQGVEAAVRYVLTPASLIEEHGVNPAALQKLVQVIELLVVDAAGLGPERPEHRYFQGRVLMAMPAVYKRLGRTDERLDRGRRAIEIFAALAAQDPARTDYRRRLAVSYDFHALDLADLGRHDEAIRHWTRQYETAAQLLVEQPEHWRWRWYQAGASANIGASLQKLGRADDARTHLEKARTLATALCADPSHEQRDSACRITRRAERLLGVTAG